MVYETRHLGVWRSLALISDGLAAPDGSHTFGVKHVIVGGSSTFWYGQLPLGRLILQCSL
jgi:hypothetical protein